jgi:hypothetical protein
MGTERPNEKFLPSKIDLQSGFLPPKLKLGNGKRKQKKRLGKRDGKF